MKRDAGLSPCGTYRYWLSRSWGSEPTMTWIMLNPSTANAEEDDHTIRKCVGFAAKWGFGGFYAVNLFAFRATKPEAMKAAIDPVGPENDAILASDLVTKAPRIVVAWGRHGTYAKRDAEVTRALRAFPLFCLGTNTDGSPRHPLTLGYDTPLAPFGVPT